MSKKPKNGGEASPAQPRISLDPDIARILAAYNEGKKRGAGSELVNQILRERFVKLGWLKDELSLPPSSD